MLDEVNTLEEITLDKDGKIDEDIRVLLLVTTLLDSVEDILTDDDTSCEEETGVLLVRVMLLLSTALLDKADESWVEEPASEDDTVDDIKTDEGDAGCEEDAGMLLLDTPLLDGAADVLDGAGRVDGLCTELEPIVDDATMLLEDNTEEDCTEVDDGSSGGLEKNDDKAVKLTPFEVRTDGEELTPRDEVVATEEGAELRHVVDIHDHE